ncbi:MAG: transposase [Cyanobacteria bacterium J06635_13]
MASYRRMYISGGLYFLTLVTYLRRPLFGKLDNVNLLRAATAKIKAEKPFEIIAAAVLPDQIHFLWQLPPNDSNYSQRISRLKVIFTRAYKKQNGSCDHIPASRLKHRESNVWQRRFWEHIIRDEADFQKHLDYIHYNPVKHGLVSCPHFWSYSSFDKWVKRDRYTPDWCCVCQNRLL